VKAKTRLNRDVDAIRTIFFDAAGTLIYLPKSVGHHYAFVAERIGLHLDTARLDRAFADCWKLTPPRSSVVGPRPDDDKGWWRELVNCVLDRVAPNLGELDRDAYFEAVYGHFAEAGVWDAYPEVDEVLSTLEGRFELAVLSNFDARLRMILEHLGLSKYFAHVFLSSELGADKPDPEIYRRALRLSGKRPNETMHVGDDPERDWQGATAAGLSIFQLDRQKNSLLDLLAILGPDAGRRPV
jgi:putative hydrolase of the HAD superfamily